MVDCRGLIEFCRSFDRSMATSSPVVLRRRRNKSLNPLSHPFCEHSPFAAIDIVIFLLALVALSVLTLPYLHLLLSRSLSLVSPALDLLADVVLQSPLTYAAALVLTFLTSIAAWEILDHKSRRCGRPHCKGLRKAVEFDIQLESEECVKCLPAAALEAVGGRAMEVGEDYRELEAELRKMAPVNGRTVLVFRAPCGCPRGRMEVWGAKKVRRIKK